MRVVTLKWVEDSTWEIEEMLWRWMVVTVDNMNVLDIPKMGT